MKKQKNSLSEKELHILSLEIRKAVFQICLTANNGHIGGSSGAVELFTTLYFGGILNYNPSDPYDTNRDRVLVRGHLGPLRYKIFSLLGFLDEKELSSYRTFGSRLHGHEDHLITPGVDITPSGSLGMLLSYGVGSAFAARYESSKRFTYVYLGDGEEQEGNVSEAARHGAHLKLDNLIVVIDDNSKQLSNPTSETDSSDLPMVWKGYGWETLILKSGHNIRDIQRTYKKATRIAKAQKKPVVIFANTVKGKGLKGAIKHFSGYHTISTCTPEIVSASINCLEKKIEPQEAMLQSIKEKICSWREDSVPETRGSGEPYSMKLEVSPLNSTPMNPDAAQVDYFRSLSKVYDKPLFFLTADVTRKDHVKLLGLESFCTFLNTGIREQHTISMAHGLSLSFPKARIIVNTLDAFTYRSIDQLNAASQGKSNMIIVGDVAGLTNSRNGRTHQTAGQPGAILMLPGVQFLEPWDVQDTYNCLNWAIGESMGIVFIRIHSSDVSPDHFYKGPRNIDSYVIHNTDDEVDITLVSSGLTVGSSLEASKLLTSEGIKTKVINVINHKSLGADFCSSVAENKPLMTIYNGAAEVLQSNVSKVLLENNLHIPSKIVGLGFDYGTTGSTAELLQHYQLDAAGVMKKIKEVLS